MINIDELAGYGTYLTYLAIQRHFTNDNYDYHKYNGKVNASREAFKKRKDKYQFAKLERKHPQKDQLVSYLVSQFMKDPKVWVGGLCTSETDKIHFDRMKVINSLKLHYEEDLQVMFDLLIRDGLSFDDLFKVKNGNHPAIFKLFISDCINIETLIILDRVLTLTPYYDSDITDPFVWPKWSRVIKKYGPFLDFDVDVYREVTMQKLKVYDLH